MVLGHTDAAHAGLLLLVVGWVQLAIGAGLSLFGAWMGAKKSADASKQAAQAQVNALDRAAGATTAAYREAQGYLAPYAQGGLNAFQTMQNLMGLNVPAGTGGTVTPTMQPGAPVRLPGGPAEQQGWMKGLQEGWAFLPPASSGQPPVQPLGALQDLNVPQAAQAQRASSYVPMQAPDGSVQPVPPEQVAYYTSRGARVLG